MVLGFRRIGKRIVLDLGDEYFLVIHLMIAGRPKWVTRVAKAGPIGLALFEFHAGCLLLPEAGANRRASLFFVRGAGARTAMDRCGPGGQARAAGEVGAA